MVGAFCASLLEGCTGDCASRVLHPDRPVDSLRGLFAPRNLAALCRQDFPQSKDSSSRSGSSRSSARFDPFGSQTDQSAYWEQRAAQIQEAAQTRARQAVRSPTFLHMIAARHNVGTVHAPRPRMLVVGRCAMHPHRARCWRARRRAAARTVRGSRHRGSASSMAEGRLLSRRQAERFGVQDVRVEPVRSKDIGRFVVPALGVTAAVILAGADMPPSPGVETITATPC